MSKCDEHCVCHEQFNETILENKIKIVVRTQIKDTTRENEKKKGKSLTRWITCTCNLFDGAPLLCMTWQFYYLLTYYSNIWF